MRLPVARCNRWQAVGVTTAQSHPSALPLVIRPLALACALVGLAPVPLNAGDVAAEMARAAAAFLEGLDEQQRAAATFPFEDSEREDWHFVPRRRAGLPLDAMTSRQRELAHALLASALSARGHATVRNIIVLEAVLAEIERNPVRRDDGKYYWTVFGTPGVEPWGWRCEGHHLAINLTVTGGQIVIATPHFFGANPAEVAHGPHRGLRVLGEAEDLGRSLVRSLTPAQRRVAIISEEAPYEIINLPGRAETRPQGIAWAALDAAQRELLLRLVRHYVERFRPEIAEDAMHRLEAQGLEALHFAWAGGLEPGEGHYYRVQTDWFVVEYDNTQNRANHVHTVWREFGHEFGRDVLAEHYEHAHSH